MTKSKHDEVGRMTLSWDVGATPESSGPEGTTRLCRRDVAGSEWVPSDLDGNREVCFTGRRLLPPSGSWGRPGVTMFQASRVEAARSLPRQARDLGLLEMTRWDLWQCPSRKALTAP